jgi:hypothetical protein
VSQTVPVAQATNDEAVLPERVQEALWQLVGAAKEGLLALSVEVGWACCWSRRSTSSLVRSASGTASAPPSATAARTAR